VVQAIQEQMVLLVPLGLQVLPVMLELREQ
jgi:hypothetical protein